MNKTDTELYFPETSLAETALFWESEDGGTFNVLFMPLP